MRWQRTFTVIGAHAEGEVGNVITGGAFDVPGETMFEKKAYLESHADGLRRRLLFEPRGAPYHAVNLLLPACRADADIGYVIMEATKYPAMSGSNTICVATVVLETGIRPMTEPETRLVLDSPAGPIATTCRCRAGKVEEVKFTNVPGFVAAADRMIEVEGTGPVRVDIAYGGIFYAIVDAGDLGFAIAPDEAGEMCRMGGKIRAACNRESETVHPENPKIRDVTNVLIAGPVAEQDGRLGARNAVVCGHGRLDRSPCGTGTSARLALMHAKGLIGMGQVFDHESIIGTHFLGEIVDTRSIGGVPAVVSTIAGQAWITGIMRYGVDPTDPFPEGHTVSDVWFKQ